MTTEEKYLREAFGEHLINIGTYPDSTLRPRIYKAMKAYAKYVNTTKPEGTGVISNGIAMEEHPGMK